MWVQVPPSPPLTLKKIVSSTTQKLVDFIADTLKISKNKAKEIVDQKRVFVNNKPVWIASHILKPSDVIEIAPPKEKYGQYQIVYEDENFIVIDKGPGLIVTDSNNSLENILRSKYGPNIKAVHRIDKDTTGLVIFAKSMDIFNQMKEKWESVEKTYFCISLNEAGFKVKEISYPIGNKPALSTVILVSKNNGLSLFKVRTFTGRKHQIRIHLSKIGFPILGDYVYGPKRNNFRVSRQMLHAYKIHFSFQSKSLTLVSPLPEDMKRLIKEYGL